MSYCRTSCTSDIHAYQTGEGSFEVCVAVRRVPEMNEDIGLQEYFLMCKDIPPIGGRFDGMVFAENSPAEVFCRLRDLLSVGYMVDPSTWQELNRFHPELELDKYHLWPAGRPTHRP